MSFNQLEEIEKCKNDIIYWCENYVKIYTVDGLCNWTNIYDYQKDFLKSLVAKDVIAQLPRQAGLSTCISAYFVWQSIFSDNECSVWSDITLKMALFGMDKVIDTYENIPEWMKPRIERKSRRYIKFDNGSSIIFGATSKDLVKGLKISNIYVNSNVSTNSLSSLLSEAHFFDTIIPILLSSTSARVCISSLPCGTPNFNKLLDIYSTHSDINLQIVNLTWRDISGRDEEWAKHMVDVIGVDSFNREYGAL